MSTLKTAVVGVGHIGREHARIYAGLDNTEFTGVYDIDPEISLRITTQHGIKRFTSLAEVAEACDALTIATPTSTHYELGKYFLQAGKHVLIEKPITNTTEEARELIELAEKNNCVLQVGHIERFNPVLRALEEKMTHPKFIEAHRLSPYPGRSTDIGVVLDLMIHDLEIVLHLVRSPIASIDSVGVAVLSKGEDIANARLRFENGAVANITTSRISPEKLRKIRVFQDDAYLSLDYQNQAGEVYRKNGHQITRETIEIDKAEPLMREISSFVDAARTGAEPVVGGSQAAEALRVAMQITEPIAESNKAAG